MTPTMIVLVCIGPWMCIVYYSINQIYNVSCFSGSYGDKGHYLPYISTCTYCILHGSIMETLVYGNDIIMCFSLAKLNIIQALSMKIMYYF